MNSAAVSKTTKLDFIKKLNLPPSPGDSGAAIGAAYYGFISKNDKAISKNNLNKNIFPGAIKSNEEFYDLVFDKIAGDNNSIEKAAENDSGTAGAGMGMGMGFAMANQMGQTFSPNQQSNPSPAKASSAPPPIPAAIAFHVAVDGKQTGPFDMETLKQMVTNNQLTKKALVWREGMPNWSAASEVSELKDIFGSIPPPIPG